MTNTTPTLTEMVTTLIGTPSVSSTMAQFDQSNLPVIHHLAEWLTSLGFDIAEQPIEGTDHKKANLLATLGEGTGGLVLSGHTDTVPFDADLWQSDPFTLTERDDAWYGLGSCDMKSFLAIAIEAVRPYAGATFHHPLTILGTADEESSMSGARALTAAGLCGARYAMIGEPTGLAPVTCHKGIMMLGLRINGSSGHSSNPELGHNALDATPRVLDELIAFREGLRTRYQNPAFEVDYPTLNLGCIHGGDNPNRICDHVDVSFDLRVLPGMDNDVVMQALREHLAPKLEKLGFETDLRLLHQAVPPFETLGDDMVTTLAGLAGTEPMSVAFATEAPFLTNLGLETVVMGPGSIDQAHQPNEFVPLSQVQESVAIIRALIERYCLTP